MAKVESTLTVHGLTVPISNKRKHIEEMERTDTGDEIELVFEDDDSDEITLQFDGVQNMRMFGQRIVDMCTDY